MEFETTVYRKKHVYFIIKLLEKPSLLIDLLTLIKKHFNDCSKWGPNYYQLVSLDSAQLAVSIQIISCSNSMNTSTLPFPKYHRISLRNQVLLSGQVLKLVPVTASTGKKSPDQKPSRRLSRKFGSFPIFGRSSLKIQNLGFRAETGKLRRIQQILQVYKLQG